MNAEQLKDTPKINHPKAWPGGLISVCGYCYPGQTLFADYPWLSIIRNISHGICTDCMRKELTKAGIVAK